MIESQKNYSLTEELPVMFLLGFAKPGTLDQNRVFGFGEIQDRVSGFTYLRSVWKAPAAPPQSTCSVLLNLR